MKFFKFFSITLVFLSLFACSQAQPLSSTKSLSSQATQGSAVTHPAQSLAISMVFANSFDYPFVYQNALVDVGHQKFSGKAFERSLRPQPIPRKINCSEAIGKVVYFYQDDNATEGYQGKIAKSVQSGDFCVISGEITGSAQRRIKVDKNSVCPSGRQLPTKLSNGDKISCTVGNNRIKSCVIAQKNAINNQGDFLYDVSLSQRKGPVKEVTICASEDQSGCAKSVIVPAAGMIYTDAIAPECSLRLRPADACDEEGCNPTMDIVVSLVGERVLRKN